MTLAYARPRRRRMELRQRMPSDEGIILPYSPYLKGYFSLDETSGAFVDEMGNADLPRAGTPGSTTGRFDNAINALGTTNYTGKVFNSQLNIAGGGTPAAIEAWVNEMANGQFQYIAINGRATDGSEVQALVLMVDSSNNMIFGENNLTWGLDYNVGSTLQNSTWHHIVGTRVGSTHKLWIDGVLKKTETVANDIPDADGYIGAGSKLNNTGSQWRGGIDDVAFFAGGVPTDEEIQLRWNAGAGRRWGT